MQAETDLEENPERRQKEGEQNANDVQGRLLIAVERLHNAIDGPRFM